MSENAKGWISVPFMACVTNGGLQRFSMIILQLRVEVPADALSYNYCTSSSALHTQSGLLRAFPKVQRACPPPSEGRFALCKTNGEVSCSRARPPHRGVSPDKIPEQLRPHALEEDVVEEAFEQEHLEGQVPGVEAAVPPPPLLEQLPVGSRGVARGASKKSVARSIGIARREKDTPGGRPHQLALAFSRTSASASSAIGPGPVTAVRQASVQPETTRRLRSTKSE